MTADAVGQPTRDTDAGRFDALNNRVVFDLGD
jgi:hypothetical protein